MPESQASLAVEAGVATLTLNRPDKRNALTQQFLRELLAAVQRVRDDASVRVLRLQAEGPVFCAGMDLGEMEQRAGLPNATELWAEDTRIYRELIEAIFRLPIPTLAVLQGPVLAGGVGLVLACDIVLASEAAWFALPEPKRGITAAVVTPLLVYRAGNGTAGYLLLGGEKITATDAARLGLCHCVAVPQSLPSRLAELTQSILTGAPAALALSKQTLHHCTADSLADQLDHAMRISAEARESESAREGLAAFLEKRNPSWHPQL